MDPALSRAGAQGKPLRADSGDSGTGKKFSLCARMCPSFGGVERNPGGGTREPLMLSLPEPPPGDAAFASHVSIESLWEIDALVGKHVMSCVPRVFWEDSFTEWRFDSLPEALEALRDPFFSSLTPEESRSRSSLREVQEFPPYSSDMAVAMTVVEHLSSEDAPLALWRSFGHWSAAFAGHLGGEAASAPLAICLAALRSRGIHVMFEGHEGEIAPGRRLT